MFVRPILAAAALGLAFLVAAPAATAEGISQGEGRVLPPSGRAPDLAGADAQVFAATVDETGALVPGGQIGAFQASALSPGIYEVYFRNRRLHNRCVWTGSIARRSIFAAQPGSVYIEPRTDTNNALWVVTFDSGGVVAPLPFMITVLCR